MVVNRRNYTDSAEGLFNRLSVKSYTVIALSLASVASFITALSSTTAYQKAQEYYKDWTQVSEPVEDFSEIPKAMDIQTFDAEPIERLKRKKDTFYR